MRKFLLAICAILLLSVQFALAQTRVRGVVTNAEGHAITGVTVMVQGTQRGVVTDNSGAYSITVPADGVLVFSFLGMDTEEVPVGNRTQIDVTMQPDAQAIEDVIVVAYGTARKESFAGSAEIVKADKLEKRTVANLTKALEGQVAGVQTSSGGGQPGSGASVRIRGFGSINASNNPLYVVDGIPYDGDIASINPGDIESMTVLKDASAGALYGARGANGVVMITTKKGDRDGSTNVSFKATLGVSSRAIPRYETVNSAEYMELAYEASRNKLVYGSLYDFDYAKNQALTDLSNSIGGERYNPFDMPISQLIDPNTGKINPSAKLRWNEDWMDEMTRKAAARQEYQLMISSGTAKNQMMLSMGYLDEDGVLKNTNFKRFSGRISYNTQPKHWFNAGLSASYSNTKSNTSEYEATDMANVWYTAQFIAPIYPVYEKNAEGKTVLDANGKKVFDYGKTRPAQTNFNSIATLYDDKFDRKRDNLSTRANLTFGTDREDAGWVKGIKLSMNLGVDYFSSNSMEYYNPFHGNYASVNGIAYKLSNRMMSYTLNQLLTWNRQFGRHNIDVLAGHEWYDYSYQYLAAGKSGLIPGMYELRPGATLTLADSYSHTYRVEGYLTRLNYNFDNKYYLSGSYRRDGSSRFYKDNRWGNFWSVGGSWRISQENFLKDVGWLNNLTIKASYGAQGNDMLLNDDALRTNNYYAWQSLYDLNYTNVNMNGGLIASLENKALTWEKNHNFNTGIEARLFNRLTVTFEWYYKKTTDLLLSFPMATSTGFNGYNANVGSMRNSGFELGINARVIQTPKFSWDLMVNAATVSNKVLKLANKPEIVSGSQVIKEGMELYTFYMPKSAGVDPMTGNQLYWVYDTDADGNRINERVSDDYAKANNSKYYHGSRMPDLYGSVGSEFRFFNIDISFLTTFSVGGKIYDTNYGGLMNVQYMGDTWSKHALRRWQKPGDVTDVPRIGVNENIAWTDKYLIDASYFAIKNITVGYTFPARWMRKANIGTLRVFAVFDNVALFTHLKGMDPQYNFTGGTDYSYAPVRTMSLGVDLKF